MKVLIAIDESACSEAALTAVADRHWPDNTQFMLVSVVQPVVPEYSFSCGLAADVLLKAEEEQVEHMTKVVEQKSKILKQLFGENSTSATVIKGHIADAIIDTAIDWDADSIVMGSHGRRGFQRFLLGSVAEKVACHAPCSVEIVKTKLSDQNGEHENSDAVEKDRAEQATAKAT
ncbi:MAG TPA: universal stress protein [Chroococcales cyanobacterium]